MCGQRNVPLLLLWLGKHNIACMLAMNNIQINGYLHETGNIQLKHKYPHIKPLADTLATFSYQADGMTLLDK